MQLTQLTLTARVGLSVAIIATGIALAAGAGCSSGASTATYCKNKIGCEGVGDQKQCEDTVAKQEKDWPTDCKSRVSSYVTCMSSGTSCTMKILASPAGDMNCAQVVREYTTCATQNPVSVTGGSAATSDAAYCKLLVECEKTTIQTKCEADQAEARGKQAAGSCREAYEAFNNCVRASIYCESSTLKSSACTAEAEKWLNACTQTQSDAG